MVKRVSGSEFFGERANYETGDYSDCGGGIAVDSSDVEISNCIVWGNSAPTSPQIYNAGSGSLAVAYSDVQGGWEGTGNIDPDPCFADSGYWDPNATPTDANDDFWVDGDYHQKSQGGRWNPNEGGWTTDEVTSPCIDAGDPIGPMGYVRSPTAGGSIWGHTAERLRRANLTLGGHLVRRLSLGTQMAIARYCNSPRNRPRCLWRLQATTESAPGCMCLLSFCDSVPAS